MKHLTRNDYANALQALARIEAHAGKVDSFARAAVRALHSYVACELTTLLICDLVTGQCQAFGLPGVRLDTDELDCFNRYFSECLRVRRHGLDGGLSTCRMSDLVSEHGFQPAALYGDSYRRIGLEYAVAMPLFRDQRTFVSVVLRRRGLGFVERDLERLELLRPHVAFLYRHACRVAAPAADPPPLPLVERRLPPKLDAPGLTPREGEVMRWLARGKTDADIAVLLAISPRTVQKHLEHVYVKLGVETRTAAVMRALSPRLREPPRDTGDGAWPPAAPRQVARPAG